MPPFLREETPLRAPETSSVRYDAPGRQELEAFRRGDPQAVRSMYQRYGNLVYTVARRVLTRHDLAEEATQQTFVRAWQAADRIDPNRDPAGWLATIAKRVAIDVYRYESRRTATSIDDVAPNAPAVVTLPPDLDTLDARWHVRRAIDALPHDEAVIVRMQHLERMTHAEIAEALGIAIGTVKSRSHRAHGKLATLLGHLRETTE
jgi:RNA polymerase sigma-70 factor (ECF subfamily)